ncbi:MAG: UDP-glucose 4-epimerase GalE [Deltaproteobacteria bacterium]
MSDTVFVVGGAGYIGSHAAQQLHRRSIVPVTLDNLSTGWRDFVRWGPFVHADIRDEAAVRAALNLYRPRLVMHFAAKIVVPESTKNPLLYYDNNVMGSLSLIRACVEHGVEQFVFSSTAAVYGEPEVVPIPLDAPKLPVNPYGATKHIVERALTDIAAASKTMGVTIFRYFNAAGAMPDARVGERHEPETHLIPNVLKAASEGRPLSVFGDDYDTPDGTCVRDYIHVSDLVRAHTAVLDQPSSPGETRVFNLGTGVGRSVREVIEACRDVTGADVKYEVKPRRPGDAPSLVAGDTEKAREALAWTPERSDVKTIVEDAWRWYQKELA